MPLESFVSFKKFLILFVLLFSIGSAYLFSKRIPTADKENKAIDLPLYKMVSVTFIVAGGIMIGYYTRGTTMGYTSSMLSNIF